MRNLFKKSPSKNLLVKVNDDETLSRFIFNRKEINKSGVKAQAFYPSTKNYETSVFRKDMMSNQEYSKTKSKIANLRKREMKGVALIKTQTIRENKLDVLSEESQHKWHANIVNWPKTNQNTKISVRN